MRLVIMLVFGVIIFLAATTTIAANEGSEIDLKALKVALSLDQVKSKSQSHQLLASCPSQTHHSTCICLSPNGPKWITLDLHRLYFVRSVTILVYLFGYRSYKTCSVLLSDNDSDWAPCESPTITKGGSWRFECGIHRARYVRIQVNNVRQQPTTSKRPSTFVKICHLQSIKIYEASPVNLHSMNARLELHIVHKNVDIRHKIFKTTSQREAGFRSFLASTDGLSLCLPVVSGGPLWTSWLRLDLRHPVGVSAVEVKEGRAKTNFQLLDLRVGFANRMEENTPCSKAKSVAMSAFSLLYYCDGSKDGVFVDLKLTRLSSSKLCIVGVYGALADYCGQPAAVPHGYHRPINTWYRNNLVVTYACLSGYQLEGSATVVCRGRIWSETPRCVETYCPLPDRLGNGTVAVSGYGIGHTASFWCNWGYEIVGRSKIRCVQQENGKAVWNDTAPSCRGKHCGVPEALVNGYVVGTEFYYLARVRYRCNEHYVLTYGSSERQCSSKGTWTGTRPYCAKIRCSFLFPPRNGTLKTNGNHFGATVRFSCNRGFRLYGSKSRQCVLNLERTDGQWTGDDPTCRAIECSEPQQVQFGQIDTDSLVYTAAARYSCEEGYELVGGDVVRYCTAIGTWSGRSPVCRLAASDCGHSCHTHSRIASGRKAAQGEFPWQSMVCLLGTHLCGGTLISDNCIVTAAHCLSIFGGREPDPSLISVCVGRVCGHCRRYHKVGDPQCTKVSRIVIHPDFNTTFLGDDIAVIRLNTSLKLKCDSVMPICLPDENRDRDYVKANRHAVVTGWGKTSNQTYFSRCLRKGNVRTVSSATCSEGHSIPVVGKVMCATDANGPCLGDSGGPLMVRNLNYKNRWVLAGVVSWGKGCGRDDSYGVYTEVLPYKEWILNECSKVADG